MGLQSALLAEGLLFDCSQYTGNVIFYCSQMKYLTDLNCHEVVLDFLMYLLKRDDLEAAKEIIQVP